MRANRSLVQLLLVCLTAAASLATAAERLALRHYTSADGLPSDRVRALLRDSPGALWVATDEGLARFDGRAFRTFGVVDGLPHPETHALLESGDGDLWVGTAGGLAVLALRGEGGTRFTPVALVAPAAHEEDVSVLALAEGLAGAIWVGTTDGLYRIARAPSAAGWRSEAVEVPFAPAGRLNRRFVRAISTDPDGSLWLGTSVGVLYRDPSGRYTHVAPEQGLPGYLVTALGRDRSGRTWVGARGSGLAVLDRGADGKPPRVTRFEHGLPLAWAMQIAQEPEGPLWVATHGGLCALDMHDPARPRVSSCLGRANGFPTDWLTTIAFGPDGLVFVGDPEKGLTRWDRRGATTYAVESGMSDQAIAELARTHDGGWVGLVGGPRTELVVRRGSSFVTIVPNLPPGELSPWWPNLVQTRDRRVWVPTLRGACVFPPTDHVEALERTAPERCFDLRDGLSGTPVFGLYEDRAGDVWISPQHDDAATLSVWRRALDRIDTFDASHGFPACHFARAFAEDPSGALWIGCYAGQLVRHRAGRFETVPLDSGAAPGSIADLLVDRRGRLWVGIDGGGVRRCDDPSAAAPRFESVDAASGPLSHSGGPLALDRDDRVYVGTAQGVFRVDGPGQLRRFGLDDGLRSLNTRDLVTDGAGMLWIATIEGIARLDPSTIRDPEPPPPVIVGVRAGGTPVLLPLIGRAQVEAIDLPAARGTLEISVAAASLAAREGVQFQYRLVPIEDDFGPPTRETTRFYPHLSAGRYRLLVRAVGPTGVASPVEASVAFRVLAPFWRQWWFIALALLAVGAAAFTLHRQRLERRLALERVRTRIATDLHDDLGSSLSSIAIQSEVLGHTATALSAAERERLKKIGSAAAEMVETMSDIVWAVNPRFDRLSQLAHRMHRFSRETLAPAGIAVVFDDRTSLDDVGLDSAARRQLYLVFKELVHNVLRHSAARRVVITIERAQGAITLAVVDDGRGFEPGATAGTGLGLESMRRRAASIGATLEIVSQAGAGTRVELKLPS